MATFAERLKSCTEAGHLTTADLSRWFERPYATVRSWLEHDREPWGWGGIEAERRLKLMERLIRSRSGFPVPSHLTQIGRRDHIGKVRREHDPRFSQARPAE